MKLNVRSSIRVPGPLRRLTVAAASDRIIATGGAGTFLLDATSGKQVAKLPAGIAAIDRSGARAVITASGVTRGGRYRWRTELWDLARGKRAAVLAENDPDDKLGAIAMGRDQIWAVHAVRGPADKLAESIVRYDAKGKRVGELALPDALMMFWLVVSADERRAAHLHFDGRGGFVELDGGKRAKLTSGVKGIGREHDDGELSAQFDAAGAHLLAVTHGGDRATVWSVASRKQVAGAWSKLPLGDAFLVGDQLCAVHDGTLRAMPVGGGPAGEAMKVVGKKARYAALGDERHAVTLGTALEVWDVAAAKRAAKARAPVRSASVLAAANGMIAVGSESGAIAVLDVA